MNPSDPIDERAVRLWIQELEDGVISPESRVHLMELMRSHESVREMHLRHSELSALIFQAAESRSQLGTMPISMETLRREKRRSAILSLGYAAAAVLALALGLFSWQASQNFLPPSKEISVESSLDASYAVVRSEMDAKAGDNLRPGDQITLKRGLLRLKFRSGVEALIEGNSQVELISDSTIRMDGGMGWFRVPGKARGFTVRTRHGRIVDLGTEFGVLFDENDNLDVHVAVGRVKVVPSGPGAGEVELTGGRAMRFDVDGGNVPLDLQASLFRRQFSKQVPHIHWSFNRLTDGVFRARGNVPGIEKYGLRPRRLDGAEVSPEGILTEGMYWNAFSMKGDGWVAESAYPGIEGNAPRTVAAWVRHRGERPPHLSDPRTGLGATTPFGNQAYLLNYTNAGLTTTEGATGVVLAAGETHTLTFHTANVPGQKSAEYKVELVAFEPGDINAKRIVSSNPERPGIVLATAEGQVTTTDMSFTGVVAYEPQANDPHLGKRLGIRLVKASASVLYDHLSLTTRRRTGEEKVVFSEDFESPVVCGFSEQTLPARHWIGAPIGRSAFDAGYGASRHGLFSTRPVFSAPWCAWSDPVSHRPWAAFTLPTGPARASVFDGQRFLDAPASLPMPTDEWTHVAIVQTGKTNDAGSPELVFYVDGKARKAQIHAVTGTPQPGSTSTTGLFLGFFPGMTPGAPTLDADIDELHILRAALTETEVIDLMDANQPVFRRK